MRETRGQDPSGGRRESGQVTTVDAPVVTSAPVPRPNAQEYGGEGGGKGSVDLRNAVECLLLVRGGPVRLSDLRKVLGVADGEIRATLAALQIEYEARGLQIQEVAGGFQLCTRPEYGPYVQRLLQLKEAEPLTRTTLEVLAIVAYRQPVTRAAVDAIRGVQSVHHLVKLQARRLIYELGRRPGPGRPILYGTTDGFLRYFGLKDIAALPPLSDHDHATILPAPAP